MCDVAPPPTSRKDLFTCNVCRLQAGSPSGACSPPWDPSQIFSLGKLETFSWKEEHEAAVKCGLIMQNYRPECADGDGETDLTGVFLQLRAHSVYGCVFTFPEAMREKRGLGAIGNDVIQSARYQINPLPPPHTHTEF